MQHVEHEREQDDGPPGRGRQRESDINERERRVHRVPAVAIRAVGHEGGGRTVRHDWCAGQDEGRHRP